jgi:hypothetical protein
MNKFKIGDRVRNLEESDYVKLGATGTVLEDSCAPFVEWDSLDMVYVKITKRHARSEDYLELILPASLKIGDTVMTPDGIGTVEYIREGAFKYPDKLGVDVKITDTDEINGYSVTDLSLPEVAVSGKPAFTVKDVTVRYENANGQSVVLTKHGNDMIRITSNGFTFANQAELDAILADFKRRAL